ncbi:MAG TPA: hypothetical protein VFB21_14030 [Chthonomonadaceae bacterium]|jgi:ABC-type phosphate transport system auxiliary subunit|nr:hypothetical protein [Chthonomonadaceae bacterium]
MKKELSGGVVVGILVVVGLIVAVLAWRVLAPPAPSGLIPMTKQEREEAMKKHGESADAIAKKQQEAFQKSRGGGP